MKSIALVIASLICLSSPAGQTHAELLGKAALTAVDVASELKATTLTPHLLQKIEPGKNVLWCATMQVAWNKMCDDLGGPVNLEGTPEMAKALNQKQTGEAELDSNAYVAHGGYGMPALDEIRQQLRVKFGDASSPALLPESLKKTEFIAYAYFFKNLPFKNSFHKFPRALHFSESLCESFGVDAIGPRRARTIEQVVIHDYVSDQDFVIELISESDSDNLLIARGSLGETLQKHVEGIINRLRRAARKKLEDDETVRIPSLNFDLTQHFKALENNRILNKKANVPDDELVEAVQNIRFKLDESGALLKSEAKIIRNVGASNPFDDEAAKPRHFICDGPFTILLLKKGQKLPYFALAIQNAELLVRQKDWPPPGREVKRDDIEPFD